MNDLLKQYIMEVIEEIQNHRVPNQLRSPKGAGKQEKTTDADKDKEQEMDEINVVANIAGFTAPLGASSADMGLKPTKPGQKLKKKKKTFARWK